MADLTNLDPEVQQYFKELPFLLQETIMQSGIPIHSKEDLIKLTSPPQK